MAEGTQIMRVSTSTYEIARQNAEREGRTLVAELDRLVVAGDKALYGRKPAARKRT